MMILHFRTSHLSRELQHLHDVESVKVQGSWPWRLESQLAGTFIHPSSQLPAFLISSTSPHIATTTTTMLPFRISPPGVLIITRCTRTPPPQARAQLPRLRLLLQRHLQRRCYAQPATKGGRANEQDLKRQAKAAAQSGKTYGGCARTAPPLRCGTALADP